MTFMNKTDMCCLTKSLLMIKYKSNTDEFKENYKWIKYKENKEKCSGKYAWRKLKGKRKQT